MTPGRGNNAGSLLERPAGRPIVIAHGANSLTSLRSALAAPGDLIEVDLWAHGDRFEVRHERAIYPLPFLAERWYLRRAPRRPHSLAEVLRELGTARPLLLDFKNNAPGAATLLSRLLAAAPGARVVASSQVWALLRAVHSQLPAIETLFSIDVQAKLDLFHSVARREPRPTGVSVRHTLLTPALVHRLHAASFAVVAWTVDDTERARELHAWGVDAITTHRPAELIAAFEECAS